jgi:hypothetical protein
MTIERTSNPTRPMRGARRWGVAMILVIIALAVATALSSAYLLTQGMSAQVSENVASLARARMIAESGLGMAVSYVRSDPEWRTDKSEGLWIDQHPFAGGTFSILGEDGEDTDGDGAVEGDGDLADDDMDMLTLTAVGKYRGCSHTVQIAVPPYKRVLMIVVDPSSLSSEDTDRYTLLRKWGWKVHLLDNQPTVAEFNAAIEGVHVIYYPSHTKLENEIRDRLKLIDLPIVTGHSRLVDELNIASGESRAYDGSAIDILKLTRTTTDEFGIEHTDVITHYITEPFPVGYLTICDGPDRLLRLDGGAIGTTALAAKVGEADRITLSFLEAGALQADKRPARARRVALPWGEKLYVFSIGSLNANGRTLLQRSLDWAGSSWRGYLPGVAVWEKIEIRDVTTVDAFRSAAGHYGGDNVHDDGTFSNNSLSSDSIRLDGGLIRANAFVSPDADMDEVIHIGGGAAMTGGRYRLSLNVPIPTPGTPAAIGGSLGDRTYGSGEHFILADKHFNKLRIMDDAKVYVTGQVRILCDDDVLIENTGQLIVTAGSSLTLYTNDKVELRDSARVNAASGKPEALEWMMLTNKLIVGGSAVLYAAVQTYDGELEVKDTGHFCGTFVGKKVLVHNSGELHIDTSISGTIVTLGGGFDLSKIAGKGLRWVERR